jgi:hypothetical protein
MPGHNQSRPSSGVWKIVSVMNPVRHGQVQPPYALKIHDTHLDLEFEIPIERFTNSDRIWEILANTSPSSSSSEGSSRESETTLVRRNLRNMSRLIRDHRVKVEMEEHGRRSYTLESRRRRQVG